MQTRHSQSLVEHISITSTLVVDHSKPNARKSKFLWAGSTMRGGNLVLKKNKMIAAGGSEALQ